MAKKPVFFEKIEKLGRNWKNIRKNWKTARARYFFAFSRKLVYVSGKISLNSGKNHWVATQGRVFLQFFDFRLLWVSGKPKIGRKPCFAKKRGFLEEFRKIAHSKCNSNCIFHGKTRFDRQFVRKTVFSRRNTGPDAVLGGRRPDWGGRTGSIGSNWPVGLDCGSDWLVGRIEGSDWIGLDQKMRRISIKN